MYPGTIFNWHDNSAINSNQFVPTAIDDAPLIMQIFSADKGPEDFVEVRSSAEFTALYGNTNFHNHGQSNIQAKYIVDNGGVLLAKRVVAKDSTLANLVVVATVTPANDATGAKITWSTQSFANCKTFDDVKTKAKTLFNDENGVYPLFVFADNGRGKSIKAVKITPDYATSKTIKKTFYTLNVYEGTADQEQITITFDPNVIYQSKSYKLDELSNVQITGLVVDTVYDAYVDKLVELTGENIDNIKANDIIFGYKFDGSLLDNITVDGVNLNTVNGIIFENGSNGEFGASPIGQDSYEYAVASIFNPDFVRDYNESKGQARAVYDETQVSDEIYDVDQHKVAAIVDANYPLLVKRSIFELVKFRKDCVFLRDYGLGKNTFYQIEEAYHQFDDQRNYFTADYVTTYQIKDPSSMKNIDVTMTYDLSGIIVSHIANNAFTPMAGAINNFVLPNAIRGTVNFTPINTPSVNQKKAMDDLRVNYAIFEDESCVVQSTYSAQLEYTQLSFINNVVAIQKVLRAVRTACPRQRFSLATANDLSNYASVVNNVLTNFITNFEVLRFVYTEDKLKATQKIFYSAIEFAFRNWAQTEIFNVYAINEI